MVLGMLPLMPVLYTPLQSHSTLGHMHQQTTLIYTTQCAAHSSVSAVRLPMVLGMLPLMPVLTRALQSHSTLSHISNQHSFTQAVHCSQ